MDHSSGEFHSVTYISTIHQNKIQNITQRKSLTIKGEKIGFNIIQL